MLALRSLGGPFGSMDQPLSQTHFFQNFHALPPSYEALLSYRFFICVFDDNIATVLHWSFNSSSFKSVIHLPCNDVSLKINSLPKKMFVKSIPEDSTFALSYTKIVIMSRTLIPNLRTSLCLLS